MKHIIGLGNPGTKYTKTRHNVGFMMIDVLAGKTKWQISKKSNSLYCYININGQEIELIKPQTYMNDSGISVTYINKKNQNIQPNDLIIIHDDVDIEFGKTKLTLEGSSGGHNGIKSIIKHLGTDKFIRLRIGVGKDNTTPTDQYVLQNFSNMELANLSNIFSKTSQVVTMIAENEITAAQRFYNTK